MQPGNSGGPLLDAHGNILGLTVAGYTDDVGSAAGLNLFIPIGEALKKLDIGSTGSPVDLNPPKK